MAKSKTTFGEFVSNLVNSSSQVNSSVAESVKKKLEEEHAKKIERRAMWFYERIQAEVNKVRDIRKQEKQWLEEIKQLEKSASEMMEGKEISNEKHRFAIELHY